MIAYDDTDLFGGRISTIVSPGFCCQLETVGKGVLLKPSTVAFDLGQAENASEGRRMLRLEYDAIWGGHGLLTRHRSLVDFLDALADSDGRLTLRAALDRMSREFRYYGNWKWAEEAGFDERGAGDVSDGQVEDGLFPRWLVESARPSDAPRRFADLHGRVDSPLAE